MKTFIMTRDELQTTITNGRWFAGFRYSYKQLSADRFSVKTNYVPVGVR